MPTNSDQRAPSDPSTIQLLRSLERLCDGDRNKFNRLRQRLEQETLLPPQEAQTANQIPISLCQLGSALPQNTLVGPYIIDAWVAQGGMGHVYRAHHRELHRQVALKVLASKGTDAHRLFERERVILSSLNHPNIAQLLESGESLDYGPWFAMQWVEGSTLDQWLRTTQPDQTVRLNQFIRIAEAVSYAHKKLVIHQDLKPSNVMIQTDQQLPILLDFGIARVIAKHLDQSLSSQKASDPYLTPAYAAPEQKSGNMITVFSDIYSLGKLFETMMNSGKKPWSKGRRGREIMAIYARCTAVNPEARYASVDALVHDVRQFIHGRVVVAYPASWWYRVRKWLFGFRWPISLISFFFILLTTFTSYSLQQKRQAEFERDQAEINRQTADEVTQFLISLFTSIDPYHSGDMELSIKDVLTAAEQRVNSIDTISLALRTRLLTTLGYVNQNLGNQAKASSLLEEALSLARQEPSLQLSLPKILMELATTSLDSGNENKAEAYYREALELNLEQFGPDHSQTLLNVHHLAVLLRNRGEIQESLRYLIQAHERVRPNDQPQLTELTTIIQNELGLVYVYLEDFSRAQSLLAEAFDQAQQLWPNGHPVTALNLNNFGLLAKSRGNLLEALNYQTQSYQMAARIYEPHHPFRHLVALNLANLEMNLGRLSLAQTRITRAQEGYLRLHGAEVPPMIKFHQTQAKINISLGQFSQAKDLLAETHRLLDITFPENEKKWVDYYFSSATLALLAGNLDLTDHHLSSFEQASLANQKGQMVSNLKAQLLRARLRLQQGQNHQARTVLKRAYKLSERMFTEPLAETAAIKHWLGIAESRHADHRAATNLFEQAYAEACVIFGSQHPTPMAYQAHLALELTKLGYGDDAEPLIEESVAYFNEIHPWFPYPACATFLVSAEFHRIRGEKGKRQELISAATRAYCQLDRPVEPLANQLRSL